MKKRIISVLIMSAMVLSMAGCNGSTESPQTTTEDSETTVTTTTSITNEDVATDTTTAADTEEVTAEITEAVTETTTTTAPEEPEETKLMTGEPKFFDDGCMVFRDGTETYIYNIANKELYTHNEAENGRILSVSGNIAIIDTKNDPYRNIDRDDSNPLQAVNIVNLKTGETIVSCNQDNNTYCCLHYDYSNPLEWSSSYIPVISVDKSFSGDKYSFGVLNNKGEWVTPMSADYEICKIGVAYIMLVNEEQWIWVSKDNQYYYYYNIENNTFSDISAAIEEYIGIPAIQLQVGVGFVSDTPIISIRDNAYNYDPITNSFEHRIPKEGMKSRGNGYYIGEDNQVYDSDYNKCGYDLSEYNVQKISAVTDDYIVFTARNDNYDDYEIIMKKDGSFVCEPFMGSAFLKGDSVIISQYVNEQAEWSVLDCTTGEISKLAYEYDCYDTVSGMLVVKSDNAYYLLDPEAPDTLINPFES